MLAIRRILSPTDLSEPPEYAWSYALTFPLGSVTEKVVRKSPCPVLTIKHPSMKASLP